MSLFCNILSFRSKYIFQGYISDLLFKLKKKTIPKSFLFIKLKTGSDKQTDHLFLSAFLYIYLSSLTKI